jgi:hypothetical protein
MGGKYVVNMCDTYFVITEVSVNDMGNPEDAKLTSKHSQSYT